MTWSDYQRTLSDVLLALDPAPRDFDIEGADPSRWRAYRRMVRARFYQVIDHAFERTIAVIGLERFHGIVDRFLAQDPPRSVYLRDVPGEFLRFVESSGRSTALPPFGLDLMRFEWAELDVAYTYEEVRPDDVVQLDMERVAAISPAHRLLALDYPVHRIESDGAGAPAEPEPVRLCVYRDLSSHEIETLVLTPVAASILEQIAAGRQSLSDVVKSAAAAHRATIDVAFVEALSTLLADLTERGVLLGSFAQTEKRR
jgi:hypothetical protein